MALDRKEFLKKACVSAACMCGFSSIAFAKESGGNAETVLQADEKNSVLVKDWITSLLESLNREPNKDVARAIMKRTSIVHYNDLKMDTMLADYQGDVKKFITFLRDKWGWKVEYDEEKKVLIADENKNVCVCPIARMDKNIDSSAMCYCSEGFAENMFSKVAGVPAEAKVVSSIRRGDATCRYRITFLTL